MKKTAQGVLKNSVLYKDYVRVVATLAVIWLHCAGDILLRFGTIAWDAWWVGNIYDSAVRWCVPVFVMLSGSLLLQPREEPISVFLKKRLQRLALPYFFWVFVYLVYTYRYDIQAGLPLKKDEIWIKIFIEHPYYHLWFVSMILAMYFFTPIFRIFTAHAKRHEIEYFLLFWIFNNCMGLVYGTFFIVRYIGWMSYLGYFVMGFYMDKYDVIYRRWFYGLGLFSCGLTAVGTYYFSYWQGHFVDACYDYLAPNNVIVSFAVFLALKHTNWSYIPAYFPKIHHFAQYFASISFGVYLMHALVLDVLKNGYLGFTVYYDNFMGISIHPLVGVPLLTITVFVLTTFAVGILCKIPVLNRFIA